VSNVGWTVFEITVYTLGICAVISAGLLVFVAILAGLHKGAERAAERAVRSVMDRTRGERIVSGARRAAEPDLPVVVCAPDATVNEIIHRASQMVHDRNVTAAMEPQFRSYRQHPAHGDGSAA
jgi:hypothetical protein